MALTANNLWRAIGHIWPSFDCDVSSLALPQSLHLVTDSRKVSQGDVFVAVPGSQLDGRAFVEHALSAGAALVLTHTEQPTVSLSERVLYLPQLGANLGLLGRVLFDVPQALEVIAVTGTNGKSSVTHYIAALSEQLGTACGVIGTLGVGHPGYLQESGLTTPGPLGMQQALGDLSRQSIRRVALEASSHALDQNRLDAVSIVAGVFTNLTRDHLDYHGSMAAYAAAKAKLFQRSELALAVVNGDDSLARLMLAGCDSRVRVLAVGSDEAVTLRVLDWMPHETGQQALVATPEGEKVLRLNLMGRFNLDNVLLAIATLYGLGEPLDRLFEQAALLSPVPGRMALYRADRAPSVVVDYAHTPDALDNALKALKAHLGCEGRLWCLFGCGGDRDAGKRAEMAAVAERFADQLVITDDNPRNEPAEQIRQQIKSGLSASSQFVEIGERDKAIEYAILHATGQDVILVAGKGHEDYQEIKGVRHPYRDDEQVIKAFAQRSPAW